jgi:hypothetical protein
MFAGGMWAFYLEAVLALCLLVFIVWWTLPKPRKDADASRKPNEADGAAAQRKSADNATDKNGTRSTPPN